PDEIENYTHRSGRTARAGKTGISISLVNAKEQGKIRQLEKVIGKAFIKKDVPNGSEVVEKQLLALISRVKDAPVNEGQLETHLPAIMEGFESLSKEEVIKRFVSLEFNRFLEYYQHAPDLNLAVSEGKFGNRKMQDNRFGRTGYKSDFTRLFINLGSVDNFSRGDMLGFICDNTNVSGKAIGKIDLKGLYTF